MWRIGSYLDSPGLEQVDFLRQADGLNRAVLAFLPFGNGRWNLVRGEEVVGKGNGRFCHLSQLRIKWHCDASAGAPVENFTVGNVLAGHLFQAKRLGAKLNIVIVPFALLTMFVLYGN